jgi:hypothetical protein
MEMDSSREVNKQHKEEMDNADEVFENEDWETEITKRYTASDVQ